MAENKPDDMPDFRLGVPFDTVPDGGLLAGTVGDDDVILTRVGDVVRAFAGRCTHLGAPLADGLVTDGVVRCPWHHACFDLATGEAVAAPAFDALAGWAVEPEGDRVRVSHRVASPNPVRHRTVEGHSEAGLVIVGGGAAAFAAAHAIRRQGHEGVVTMISAEIHAPYDRTLLTKDYLDGTFGDDRLPIAATTLDDLDVVFMGGVRVTALDPRRRHVDLDDGRTLPYTKLLLATGAEPKRLDMPGANLPHVHLLRSLDDCRGLIAMLRPGVRVVVVGSSFIGLEAAASIRSRGIDVTVVTPEAAPMAKVLGPDLSRTILATHAAKGVILRLNAEVAAVMPKAVRLADGTEVAADIVVVGIGVVPRVELAAAAGLSVENGVIVDTLLRTSDPDIFAAGDIAAWPDPHTGRRIRVEHWAVAERQGQVAGRNMLGGGEPFTAVPFFWSKHFDFSFRFMGHAEKSADAVKDGDPDGRDAVIRYRERGQVTAVATVGRDKQALEIEHAMEGEIAHR